MHSLQIQNDVGSESERRQGAVEGQVGRSASTDHGLPKFGNLFCSSYLQARMLGGSKGEVGGSVHRSGVALDTAAGTKWAVGDTM